MTSKYINVIELDDSGSTCVVSSGLVPLPGGAMPNLLINGNFSVAQRGTSFDSTTSPANDDDTYLLDRWVLLSDGDDIVDVDQVETASDLPTGAAAAIKYTWETANKQAGLLQIIEGINARPAIGGTVSLSFQAKGSGLENLRAAVLSWDSAEDSVTSDVVATWAGDGTNPTFATNWTAENTPSDLALSTSWQTFTIEGVDIDTSSMTNVAVFIWLDDTDVAVDDTLFVTNVKLEVGEAATPFVPRSYGDELALCQRYFVKTFRQNVVPAQNTNDYNGSLRVYATSSMEPVTVWKLPVSLRKSPADTASGYPASDEVQLYAVDQFATANQWSSTGNTLSNARSIQNSEIVVAFDNGGSAATATAQWYIHATVDVEL
ncbi:MAG: hypothetical protein JJ900_04290 [Rhodospirillales bacterium]|nr:hypothetical protein [Rhodospirillales bacterium]MBO6786048.1 hypothetical protein [Rhodospirillales bacterium]